MLGAEERRYRLAELDNNPTFTDNFWRPTFSKAVVGCEVLRGCYILIAVIETQEVCWLLNYASTRSPVANCINLLRNGC
jgi:hypothetical protein